MKKRLRLVSCTMLLLSQQMALANHFYAFLNLNADLIQTQRDSNNVIMAPDDAPSQLFTTRYDTAQTHLNNSDLSIGAGIGWQFPALFAATFSPQQAVELSIDRQTTRLNGQVAEWAWIQPAGSSVPIFSNTNNANFSYSIDNVPVLVNYLFYLPNKFGFNPYVQVGIGFSQHYTQFSGGCNTNCVPADQQNFAAKTMTTFAYDVGMGITKQLNQDLTLALTYQFTDLGKVKSGPGTITNSTSNPPLTVAIPAFENHINTNAIQLRLLAFL